jgi:putative NADH-flavin reductase
MKIAILGATRGTGRCALDQALARGDDVRVLARNVAALPTHERLTVVQGDARKAADVEQAVAGVDAVLSCIGSAQLKVADHMVSECAAATVAAMQKQNVTRLVLVSVQGIGDSANAAMKMLIAPVFKRVASAAYDNIFADKERAEAIVRASSLEWTLVRGPRLTDDAPKGRARAVPSAGGTSMGKISRADLATFMLDEATKRAWVKQAVLVID